CRSRNHFPGSQRGSPQHVGADDPAPARGAARVRHLPGVKRDGSADAVRPIRADWRDRRRLTDAGLLGSVSGQMASGHFLSASNESYPTVVLGAQAASILQIPRASGHIQLYIGGTWFTVVGILKPVILDSNLDATVFIGLPVAERLF